MTKSFKDLANNPLEEAFDKKFLSNKSKKTNKIVILTHDDDYNLIKNAANKESLPVSTFVRVTVLKHLKHNN